MQSIINKVGEQNITLSTKVISEGRNILSIDNTGIELFINDKAHIDFCWDNGLLVGGSGGGFKTSSIEETIEFILYYIRKYY